MTCKRLKKQPTKAEVKQRGKYLGFTELANGIVNQYWELDGIVFCEASSETSSKWFCDGKASKFHAIAAQWETA